MHLCITYPPIQKTPLIFNIYIISRISSHTMYFQGVAQSTSLVAWLCDVSAIIVDEVDDNQSSIITHLG